MRRLYTFSIDRSARSLAHVPTHPRRYVSTCVPTVATVARRVSPPTRRSSQAATSTEKADGFGKRGDFRARSLPSLSGWQFTATAERRGESQDGTGRQGSRLREVCPPRCGGDQHEGGLAVQHSGRACSPTVTLRAVMCLHLLSSTPVKVPSGFLSCFRPKVLGSAVPTAQRRRPTSSISVRSAEVCTREQVSPAARK